jgi:Fe-S-cluster containining protein
MPDVDNELNCETSGESITVHSLGVTIPRERVLFAFASGRLGYDCISCNAQCCRGHGYELNVGPELDRQLQRSSALKFFLRPVDSNGTKYLVQNCPPGCFFLNDAGLCDIQARYGYDSKPETCRLFPFNNIRFVSGYLLVAPHSSLCPLRIVEPPTTSQQSSHAELFRELCRAGIKKAIQGEALVRSDVPDAVACERTITTVSERHLADDHYSTFAAAQVQATWGRPGAESGVEPATIDVMRRHMRLACKVLGADVDIASCVEPALTRTLVAATPVLRSIVRFPPDSAPADARLEPERIPYVLSALFVLLVLAKRTGMGEVTFQTVMRIWQTEWLLLALLSRLDQSVVWRADMSVVPPRDATSDQMSTFVAIAKALLPEGRRRPGRVLGELLCEILDSDGVDRIVWLRAVAPSLMAAIVPLGEAASCQAGYRKYRIAFERWIWRHLDDRILTAAIVSRLNQARAASARPRRHGRIAGTSAPG